MTTLTPEVVAGSPVAARHGLRRWAILAVVVALVAALGIGGWMVAQSGRSDAEKLVDKVAMIWSDGTPSMVDEVYASTAMYVEITADDGSSVTKMGAKEIQDHVRVYRDLSGFEYHRVGEVVQHGNIILSTSEWSVSGDRGLASIFITLDDDGMIAHETVAHLSTFGQQR